MLPVLLSMAGAAAGNSSSWQCGTPLSSDYDYVNTEYSTWKGRYLKSMGSTSCCIRRPCAARNTPTAAAPLTAKLSCTLRARRIHLVRARTQDQFGRLRL